MPRPWDVRGALDAGCSHVAQLSASADGLAREAARFLAEGARSGELAVAVVSTGRPALLRALDLEASGWRGWLDDGRLELADAGETIERVAPGGTLRPEAVRETLRAWAGRAGPAGLRVYGETSDELRRAGRADAALELERACASACGAPGVRVLCGYALDVFDPAFYDALPPEVWDAHQRVVPAASAARFSEAVRAAVGELIGPDVFGSLWAAASGRELAPRAASGAHGRLLWLRRHMPATFPRVLSLARHRYERLIAVAA